MAITAPSLKSLARYVWKGLNRPEVAVLLESENLLVHTPGAGAVWPRGTRQAVAWYVVGPAGDVVDVELVTMDGSRSRTRAVLVTGVATHRTGVTVTVPALPPGRYLVLVTSATGALDSYSQPVTITA
ncbi:GPI anchored serine-threonine rich family protein [Streptomyces sp. NBC_00335]|uniref:Ser-Thr-rich GPI-anchored membrane family protein n=1 Tax=unclassified Streptomyces TaxID=2593676 RepID=UPI002256C4BA|nr:MULTISPECIES: Ser-Thr-rich GPI-anchored membrane family protein [unclassified Streptomyces]MCX5405830.1 GPI anchored serine-threonine rich family protein [Streptomyces sp. NBC_00086]